MSILPKFFKHKMNYYIHSVIALFYHTLYEVMHHHVKYGTFKFKIITKNAANIFNRKKCT